MAWNPRHRGRDGARRVRRSQFVPTGPGNEDSNEVHSRFQAGDRLRVGTPRNNFSLDESAESSLFIAGGIGVTPVLSMIRRLEALGRKWVLHYATRERKRTAFLQELIDLSRSETGNLHLHFDDERPGRFLDLGAIVARASADSHLYCCGPAPMLQAFEAATSDRCRDRIHVEYFSPKSPPATSGGFELVLLRSGRALYVSAGTTILDTLLAENVDVAYSCKEGTCGTCETRVLEGVPDHRDVVLSDAERRSNSIMMICCSGAKSPRLVLDL